MTKNLAVVIVTYNRCELLQQSLNALAQQTFPIDNVIVVNNASTDGITEPFLDNYPSGQVGYLTLHTIHNPENTGGAGGFSWGGSGSTEGACLSVDCKKDLASP